MTPPASYFTLFDLEPRFAIAAEQLDRAYRTAVARVHPDRHARASAGEQIQALSLATQVNEAYRTLRRPSSRARHLLDLRGLDPDGTRPTMATDFLLEQMEWREALDEAQVARDGEALARLATTVRARAATLLATLEAQLDTGRDDRAATRSVNELLFVEKLLADLDEALARMED
jgi:molecular chaperone HscB